MKNLTLLTILAVAVISLSAGADEARAVNKKRLVKTTDDAKVFLVENDRRIHIPNPAVFEAGGYRWGDIETISNLEMDQIRDTALIKSPVDAKVYLIKDGKKSWIPDEAAFLGAGRRWEDIVLISQAQVDFYESSPYEQKSVVEAVRIILPDQPPNTDAKAVVEKAVVDLGILGSEFNLERVDLNNFNQVTVAIRGPMLGSWVDSNGHEYFFHNNTTFLWDDGKMIELGENDAVGVNKGRRYKVIKNVETQKLVNGALYGAIKYIDGKKYQLGTLGGISTAVSDINDANVIIGSSDVSGTGMEGGSSYAFVWKNGKMTALETGDSLSSTANAINNKNQIAGCVQKNDGTYNCYPALWENGKMSQLEAEKGWTTDINDSGLAVGQVWPWAYSWEKKIGAKLAAPPRAWQTAARAVNNHGEIVGVAHFNYPDSLIREIGESRGYAGAFLLSEAYVAKAVLWKNGKVYDLNNLLPAGSNIHLSDAIGINDNGKIIVRGFNKGSYDYRIFVVSLPSDIPDTASVFSDTVEVPLPDVASLGAVSPTVVSTETEEVEKNF